MGGHDQSVVALVIVGPGPSQAGTDIPFEWFMPYSTAWVDPAIFMKHGSATVFCTYKNDDVEQGPNKYRFSLHDLCGMESCTCDGGTCRNVFDVRDLPGWTEPSHPPFLSGEHDTPENRRAWEKHYQDRVEETHIENVIRDAFLRGFLSAPSAPATSAADPGPSLEILKADCLVIRAPDWFKREDFLKWRSHKDVVKWDWVGEGRDTFLVYDGGDLSDDGFLPEDIAAKIHAEAERIGMEYGTIWLKAV